MDHLELQLHPSTLPLYSATQLHIMINGRSLIEWVRQVERPFCEHEGRPDHAGNYDWLGAADCELFDSKACDIPLLGCTCGETDCWPLMVQITRQCTHVQWHGFYNPFRTKDHLDRLEPDVQRKFIPWDYSTLGPFTFDSKQYKSALRAVWPDIKADRARIRAEKYARDIEWQAHVEKIQSMYGDD